MEGGDERFGPGPIGLEPEAGAAAVADDPPGDMQEPVAQPLWFGACDLAGQAEQLHPAEQVLGDQRELEPGLVVREGVVGEVAHAGVLAGTDAVLDPRATAVAQLERGNVLAVLVGEQARVAVAVLVEDLKLRARVGSLPADNQPRALRPGGEVDVGGELSDPGAVAVLTVGVDRLYPRGFRQLEDRTADTVVQLVADREADVRLAAVGGERVRRATDVCPDEDVAVQVLQRGNWSSASPSTAK